MAELSFSRPLPQSQRGEGRVIAHVAEAAGPPRPILTPGSLEVTSARAEAAELLTDRRQRRNHRAAARPVAA